jgi:glycosyltransferase involved in cell wall biosynthesis
MILAGKKILICEEGLIDTKGHFYAWIKAIRQMHLEEKAQVFIAGSVHVDPRISEELGVMPVYTVNAKDNTVVAKWPAWRRTINVFVQNWRCFVETRRALRAIGSVDVLMFTAARVQHLLGLRILCALSGARSFQRMVIFVLLSHADYSADFASYKFSRKTLLVRGFLNLFSSLVRSQKVLLAGDSHITCGEYERMTGLPMALFPSPGGGLQYPRTVAAGPAPVFTVLGVSTWDKGLDIFQDAILRFLKRNPEANARFVLQWGVDCITREGRTIAIDDRLRVDSRVTFLERSLGEVEYKELLGNADFVVLPYRRITYFNRISGVAVEAACSGKPMLVTQGTWLEWALNEFGSGFTFPEGDAEALASLLERCCLERDAMDAEARRRMATALDYNSSKRYLELLWPKN